jgi:hypothetical protein
MKWSKRLIKKKEIEQSFDKSSFPSFVLTNIKKLKHY